MFLFAANPITAYLLSVSLLSRWTSLITGNVRPCERVVLFPTIASQVLRRSGPDVDNNNNSVDSDENEWLIPVHGWVFTNTRHKKRRRVLLSLLRKTLKTEPKHKSMLERRLTPFIVDNKSLKRVRIQVENTKDEDVMIHKLPRTAKNGHFHGLIRLSLNQTKRLKASGDGGGRILKYHALLDDASSICCDDGRVIPGEVHLLEPTGLSVISDIDDTIKISNVTSTKALLRNTFLEDFEAVPGMAQIYQQLYKNRNASIHFVSSSPWQLYEDLQEFTTRAGFPPATFDLKSVRVKDRTLLNLIACPLKAKTRIIEGTLTRFPRRQFIFVGDSGEKDAEVYGALARRFPRQVQHVLIRNIGNLPPTNMTVRMEEAFDGIPNSKWTVFEDTSEIPTYLYEEEQEASSSAASTSSSMAAAGAAATSNARLDDLVLSSV
mmetsp:Transcript_53941/g.80479  ORF Transcript_53941/g.80479 Transcript_53941/m.80479 type:complete len:435 (-) Transcript_53941:126-1430(-)